MPIRTTRGRAAAYRAVWQWPLRSPARFAITLVGVVAVAALVGAGAAAASGNPAGGGILAGPASAPFTAAPVTVTSSPSASSTAPATSTTPVPTALPPVPELSPTTLPLSQAPAAALQVAGRWAAAWVRPPDGTTQQQWLDGLRATTTDEYLGVLSTVDPSNIAATKVTGSPSAVGVSPRSVQVQVPTDALKLLVTVVVSDTGDWRVSDSDKG